VKGITEWFIMVVGCNPFQEEMEACARRLFDLGFHSVELIELVCVKGEGIAFVWTKKAHKALVAAALPA
jgi:hypothetical protein